MNIKPTTKRKRNHYNIYVNDSDGKIIETVMKAHPDMSLGTLLVYSLRRVYGQSFQSDYNAQMIQVLHQWRSQLSDDVLRLEKELQSKKDEIETIDSLLKDVMKGDDDDEQ